MKTTRELLLEHLKRSAGSWISGEWLSRELEVSRAAVNKHVRHLQKMGYPIGTSTRKGYLLGGPIDLVLPEEIRDGLGTRIFGARDIVYLAETDSTNLRARDLAAGGAPEGTIVIAERQTAGRGRKGRSWFSPAGQGIYLSLILRPPVTPGEAAGITLMTGVAAAEALISVRSLDVTIRWPNDVLVNGRKIAGILTEISTEMDRIDHVVVGLGVNVNNCIEDLHPQIRETATSVFIETGEVLARAALVRAVLGHFEAYYGIFLRKGFQPFRQRWKELSGIVGCFKRVEMIGRTLEGVVVDIDAEGLLVLEDEQGRHHRIVSGDVSDGAPGE